MAGKGILLWVVVIAGGFCLMQFQTVTPSSPCNIYELRIQNLTFRVKFIRAILFNPCFIRAKFNG